jgi:hypothetical protein
MPQISKEELELRLATTLAPMLLTVAIFSLSSMTLVSKPAMTWVDELLSLIAAFSIFAAALIIDFALDHQQLSSEERLKFLGGGYLFFCIVVGIMTAAVFILYSAVQVQSVEGKPVAFGWQKSFIPFFGAGISVSLKMMWFRDRNIFFFAMLIFYSFSIYALAS